MVYVSYATNAISQRTLNYFVILFNLLIYSLDSFIRKLYLSLTLGINFLLINNTNDGDNDDNNSSYSFLCAKHDHVFCHLIIPDYQ